VIAITGYRSGDKSDDGPQKVIVSRAGRYLLCSPGAMEAVTVLVVVVGYMVYEIRD